MIISRTPYRISFFGGGTDYPAWYKEHGGQVLSTTIDKYLYITCRYLPPFFEDRLRLVETAGQISEASLFVDDSPSRTVTEIAAGARRIVRREGRLGVIVIDYLQLVEPDNSKDPRQEQVAKITRRLKGLARELSVPILCLAQLNRQAEMAKENRPRLNHLRESGAIEQDADVVMFVHREEYYHSGAERDELAGQAEIIVAKQRNGPVGDVGLVWRKEFTRFSNRAQQAYDDFEQFNSSDGF